MEVGSLHCIVLGIWIGKGAYPFRVFSFCFCFFKDYGFMVYYYRFFFFFACCLFFSMRHEFEHHSQVCFIYLFFHLFWVMVDYILVISLYGLDPL